MGPEVDSFAIAGEPMYRPAVRELRVLGLRLRSPRPAYLEVEAVGNRHDLVRVVAGGSLATALRGLGLRGVLVARGIREPAPADSVCDRPCFRVSAVIDQRSGVDAMPLTEFRW